MKELENLARDLENKYEGEIGTLEVRSYWCEYPIEGDNDNMLYVHYKDNKEIEREIRPKRKPYDWE